MIKILENTIIESKDSQIMRYEITPNSVGADAMDAQNVISCLQLHYNELKNAWKSVKLVSFDCDEVSGSFSYYCTGAKR